MKLRAVVLAILLGVLAGPVWAGTITRTTKNNGTTDWNAGDLIRSSEMNGDFNAIFNEFNGSIGLTNLESGSVASDEIVDGAILNADVNASAVIDGSKLDDHADNDTTYLNTTDGGSTASTSRPTTLEGEIERLRFALKRLGLGEAIDETTLSWVDDPIWGPNLIYHGGFEGTDGDGDSAATVLPDGWTIVATPGITYAATEVGEGGGLELVMVANAVNEGISQTLTDLKASTSYLITTRAKRDAGTGSCELRTTGGGTNASITTTSATYVTLSDVFVTDATPADIVAIIEADTSGDTCSFDGVAVYEMNPDPEPRPGAWKVSATGGTSDLDCGAAYGAGDCDDLVSVTVDTPGPGYLVSLSVSATLGGDCSYRLHDETNGTQLVEQHQDLAATTIEQGVSLQFTVVNPSPGAIVYDFDALNTSCDYEGSTHGPAYLEAVVIPVGR